MRARDNPLTVQRVRALRYRLRGTTLVQLRQRLAKLGYRAAIVGPHGHGKTTLMEDLAADLRRDGWEIRGLRLQAGARRLPREEQRDLFAGAGRSTLLFIDGVDELAPLARWRLLRDSRRAAGLLVASHHAGPLPTLWRCETSAALLRDLLAELGVDPAALPGRPADELFARHRGDLRAALRELYDAYACLPDDRRERPAQLSS